MGEEFDFGSLDPDAKKEEEPKKIVQKITTPPAPRAPPAPKVDVKKEVEQAVGRMRETMLSSLDDRMKEWTATSMKEVKNVKDEMLRGLQIREEKLLEIWDEIFPVFQRMWKLGSFNKRIAKFNTMLRGQEQEPSEVV